MKLEDLFQKTLRKSLAGKQVYDIFCRTVNQDKEYQGKSSIFFRIRDEKFGPVSKNIQRMNSKELYKAPVNFNFCKFQMSRVVDSSNKSDLAQILADISSKRQEIVSASLYLAMHRQKVFYSMVKKNPQLGARASMEDFVQTANLGLFSAVDKYVPDQQKKDAFVSMANGWMNKYLQEYYHEASSHLTYSSKVSDKAFQAVRFMEENPEQTDEQLQEQLDLTDEAFFEVVTKIRNPGAYKSLDERAFYGAGSDSLRHEHISDEDLEPDIQYRAASPEDLAIEADIRNKILNAQRQLSLLQRKILLLKGELSYEIYKDA